MAETTLVNRKTPEKPAPEVVRGGLFYTPRVDIYETPEELVFLCDVPGVKPADLEIGFCNGELSLHGKAMSRPEGPDCLLCEYGVGDFYRSFTVPPVVDSERFTAECHLGVVVIHLPK